MSENSEVSNYKDDQRTPCRYGLDCYQKNAAHHEKFKHPTRKKKESMNKQTEQGPSSSQKIIMDKEQIPKKKTLLTDWLKSPPNKKPKVQENKNANRVGSPNSSKDKTLQSPSDNSKNNKFDKHTNQKEENKKKVEIIHNVKEKDKIDTNEESKEQEVVFSNINKAPLQMDAKSKIKHFFLVDMPDDFYQFWEFCESLGSLLLVKGNPTDALKKVGLSLVGPFDVLANKFNDNIIYDRADLLRHYRYYYDVPEFQTVIKGDDKTGYHLGYFRDDPKEKPVFVASNCAAENGIIKSVAENLFGAINIYLEDYKKTADPFAKLKIIKLQNSLTTWANEKNIVLSKSTAAMKQREASVVTLTFHKAGLVVPYNKKTELGYRELSKSDATIKGILKDIVNSSDEEERKTFFSKLFPIITYANIANDECDFGTSLELGLDLFTFGSPLLHETVKRLTITSYNLLGRNEFAEIIEAHLQDRKKGSDLSILKKS